MQRIYQGVGSQKEYSICRRRNQWMSSLLVRDHAPKANSTVVAGRRGVVLAEGRAYLPPGRMPSSPALYPETTGRRACWVRLVSGGVGSEPVRNPLPDIPGQVQRPTPARAVRETTCRNRAPSTIAITCQFAIWRVVPPWVNMPFWSARGVLPFRLCRQPSSDPLAVSVCAVPRDHDHGTFNGLTHAEFTIFQLDLTIAPVHLQ
jgi:hypothetical protein